MKEILIEYQNQTYNHSVLPFESVHSICNKFCQSKNINESDIGKPVRPNSASSR